MKGQIRQRGNSYSVIVPLPPDGSGKKHYKWVTCHSKREAEGMRAELIHQVNNGLLTYVKGSFGDFFNRWMVEYAKPSLSPTTAEGYAKIYRAHLADALGNVPLKKLKPEIIQKFYADMLAKGLSTTTVRHYAMLIHRVLDQAVKWQLLVYNPADNVTPPRTRDTEMRTLDETEIDAILREAENGPYYTLFYLGLWTGMRRSELLGLRWSDIDLPMAEISVSRSMHRLKTHEVIFRGTKTAKSKRVVALSPSTCITLRKHLDNEMALCNRLEVPFGNDRLLFCQWDGAPLLPAVVSQAWKRLTTKLGIENIHFHSMRHTHASIMLRRGVNVKVVSERLGHANTSVTLNVYAHVSPDMQRKAAESFDEILTPKNSKRIASSDFAENEKV